jgi:biopolymer transport protein ExbD
MDALTIILIFLLTNYSEQPEENDLPDFIKLPITVGGAVMAQKIDFPVIIGTNKIQIGKTHTINFSDFDSEIERVMEEYRTALKDEKERIEKERAPAAVTTVEKDAPKIHVSIQADKGIQYKVIDKFLLNSAEAGVNFFNFVIQKKQEG